MALATTKQSTTPSLRENPQGFSWQSIVRTNGASFCFATLTLLARNDGVIFIKEAKGFLKKLPFACFLKKLRYAHLQDLQAKLAMIGDGRIESSL